MAGLITHLYIADRIFTSVMHNIFPKDKNPEKYRQYFLAGSIFPDIGQFPGEDWFVSGLSHYARTKDLVMNMIKVSQNNEELAFSYGWMTHIYADLVIHPFIHKKVAENVKNYNHKLYDPLKFKPRLAHMRLEFGYDLELLNTNPYLSSLNFKYPFNKKMKGTIMQRTYLFTYGYELKTLVFRHSIRSISSGTRRILKYYSFLNFLRDKKFYSRIVRFLAKLLFFSPFYFLFWILRSPATMALLNPYKHEKKDFIEYTTVINRCFLSYKTDLNAKFAKLRNFNLDTGRVSVFGTNKYADITIAKWVQMGIEKLRMKKIRKSYPMKNPYKEIKKYLGFFYKKKIQNKK